MPISTQTGLMWNFAGKKGRAIFVTVNYGLSLPPLPASEQDSGWKGRSLQRSPYSRASRTEGILPAMSRVELMDACDMQKYFCGIYWVETNTTISRWNEVTSVFWIMSQMRSRYFLIFVMNFYLTIFVHAQTSPLRSGSLNSYCNNNGSVITCWKEQQKPQQAT